MTQLEQPAQGASTVRLTALDVSRALAIFGMIIVNVGSADSGGVPALIVTLLHGRAAILFIVLAGVGVTILGASLRAKSAPLGRNLGWRAAVLLVLGLALQQLPTGVNVILMLYAALFVTALAALRLPAGWLLGASAAVTVLGPVIYIWLHSVVDLQGDAAAVGRPPLESATSILLTGPYPLIVWVAPFFFGMWLGRLNLRSVTVQRLLILTGALIAAGCTVLSWVLIRLLGEPDPDQIAADHLLLAAGHSQMPLWLISAVGTAMLAIGLLLVLTPRLGRAASPLIVTGQLALTAYCLHLVAIAVLVRPASDSPHRGLLVSAAIIAMITVVCIVWRMFATRGPLEILLRLPNVLKR